MGDSTLFDQYQTVVARNKDLHEQMKIKEEQWDRRDEEFRITEQKIKDLCYHILQTDRNEIKLGKSKTWDSLPINTLIDRTMQSYVNHTKEWTKMLGQQLNDLENRREKISDLEAQISRLLVSGGRNVTKEELDKETERQKKEEEFEKKAEQKKKSNKNIRANIVSSAEEEDDDFIEPGEAALVKDANDINQEVKVTPLSTPYKENKKNKTIKKKMGVKAMAQMININDYAKDIDPVGWMVIEEIGSKGTSEYGKICAALRVGHNDLNETRIRISVHQMLAAKILRVEKVKNPISKTLTLYELADIGECIYARKFNDKPVESEMSRIRREHSNLEHGYGIKSVAEKIIDSNEFAEVTYLNDRKPIKPKEGIEYIPDIILKDKNGKVSYIEYEIGTTTDTDFKKKCARMMMVDSMLNFVVPNKTTLPHLTKQVEKWIEASGVKALGKITIRITPATQIGSTNFYSNQSWSVVFVPDRKGSTPYINN